MGAFQGPDPNPKIFGHGLGSFKASKKILAIFRRCVIVKSPLEGSKVNTSPGLWSQALKNPRFLGCGSRAGQMGAFQGPDPNPKVFEQGLGSLKSSKKILAIFRRCVIF